MIKISISAHRDPPLRISRNVLDIAQDEKIEETGDSERIRATHAIRRRSHAGYGHQTDQPTQQQSL
jgi:hypothetical protein